MERKRMTAMDRPTATSTTQQAPPALTAARLRQLIADLPEAPSREPVEISEYQAQWLRENTMLAEVMPSPLSTLLLIVKRMRPATM